MRYTIENRDKIVIFSLNNERLDGHVSAKFKAELLILCQPDIEALVINLKDVKAIDSSGLGALLLAHRQLKDYAIPIALIGVNEYVRTLLDISQIEPLFEYYDSIDEAVQEIS